MPGVTNSHQSKDCANESQAYTGPVKRRGQPGFEPDLFDGHQRAPGRGCSVLLLLEGQAGAEAEGLRIFARWWKLQDNQCQVRLESSFLLVKVERTSQTLDDIRRKPKALFQALFEWQYLEMPTLLLIDSIGRVGKTHTHKSSLKP